jgi:hypothetical protein
MTLLLSVTLAFEGDDGAAETELDTPRGSRGNPAAPNPDLTLRWIAWRIVWRSGTL